MIAELGHLSAFLALAAAMTAAWFGLRGIQRPANVAMMFAATYCTMAFVLLVWAFTNSDFSLRLVVAHSHSLKPFFYKIAGAWGNHEGSMLLWCVIMLGFGAAAVRFMEDGPLKARALGVQGALATMSLAYLVFASSPFDRLDPAPLDGTGLNPLLQDPALAFHPPFLYLGYVGFSFVFSLAAAGLILGDVGQDWARRARPWALFAWSGLTVGISLGAIWAYYELGWGGWWFWDPVENASLMPWLVGAALVHSIIVTQKRGSMAAWTALLSVLAFCLSILGAFLVRSGVLTSVHAFALDPRRGMLLLIGLAIAGGFALGLYAWRAGKLKSGAPFDPVSREGALILNNLFLSVAAATVLVGTLYPLAVEALTGEKLSVGPPYFDLTLAPLMGVLFLAPPVAAMLAWRRAELAPALRNLVIAGALALAAGGLAVLLLAGNAFAVFGVAVGVWLIAGTVIDLATRAGGWRFPRAAALGLGVWGMTVAHIGLGVFVIGAVSETHGRIERTFAVAPEETFEMAGRQFTFLGVRSDEGPNFYSDRATIKVEGKGRSMTLSPEKRYYPAAGMPTTEVAIRKSPIGDLYVALGEPVRDTKGGWTLRVSINPMIDWVFGGAFLVALGGFVSFASRKHRIRSQQDATTDETVVGAVAEPAE